MNPEGEVDWLATARDQAMAGTLEFVSRSSRLQMDDDEFEALNGWKQWVSMRWESHVASLGRPDETAEDPPWGEFRDEAIELRQIKRWAQIARRSRWPLLRSIVAESLRAEFEDQLIDSLPLPSDPARLFELICLVRVLRALEPTPVAIRWLDHETEENRLRVPGVTCYFQKYVSRGDMLETAEFGGGLREAVLRHAVGLPERIDGLCEFDRPRAGFVGVLIEAKSGAQDPRAAIFQLKCYRAALRRTLPGPLIVWGIVEKELDARRRLSDDWMRTEGDDLWVFSSANEIPEVMKRLLD